MATHAGHATGIDQVQGLEGGATPGPLGQLWATLCRSWGPEIRIRKKKGETPDVFDVFAPKQFSQPFHLLCICLLVLFLSILCCAELHDQSLS